MHGELYHNLAIDESHKCVINKRVKSITSRPSHFHTVELAHFLAHAKKTTYGLERISMLN